jgi:hypothetical protein
MEMTQCWASLASAVINAGIIDREKAVCRLKRNPSLSDAKEMLKETDEFFNSTWFEELLAMSGIDMNANEFRERVYGC